ncbi:MAG: DUF370 domain-containing protein, partial [Gemmiger qucibialis]|nr:DUF370 domain-containing protein [Gemmiger qucibialis]
PLPLLRFAVSATGGAHLCSIQYYLRFWPSICRTSLAVSALRIMRYCPNFSLLIIMYLHLGQDFIVNTRDVIGVFDLDTATDAGQKAKITDEFLRHAQQEGAVVDVSGSMPKSFVLTDFPDDTVYITQISTAAIRNRAAKFDMGQ